MDEPGAEPIPVDASDQAIGSIAGDTTTLQVLMAEHASLVSARSLAYNEAFTRAGMFLQALGMSFIGLSLLAAAMGFGTELLAVATIVLAFDVVIGVATFVRVAATGSEDLNAMQAMNRIRRGYLRIAPPAEPFISTGTYDDIDSVMATYGFRGATTPLGDAAYGLSTSLGMVGMVLAMLSGVLAAVIALALGGSTGVALLAGAAVALLVFAVCLGWALSAVRANQAVIEVRFRSPNSPNEEGPPGA